MKCDIRMVVFIVGWSYFWFKTKKKSMKWDMRMVVFIVRWSYYWV